jgi:uncharacterized protein
MATQRDLVPVPSNGREPNRVQPRKHVLLRKRIPLRKHVLLRKRAPPRNRVRLPNRNRRPNRAARLNSTRPSSRSRRRSLAQRNQRYSRVPCNRLRSRIRKLSSAANRSKLNIRSRRNGLLPRRKRRDPRSSALRSVPRSINKTMTAIEHERTANRFTAAMEGHVAVLDYTLAGNVMSITHTNVPPAIGGRGVAAELMRAALSAANSNGWSVNPVCSYAVAYLRRHPLDPHKQHVEDLLDEALDESFPASDSPSVGGSS